MSARRLKVMIDARMLIGPMSGVARFVTRMVDEIAAQENVDVIALCGPQPYEPWRDRSDVKLVTSSFDLRHRTVTRRLLWEQLRLPGLVQRVDPDVFHATWNFGVPQHPSAPVVLTVHDLIPWHECHAYYPSRWHRLCYRRAIRTSVRRATVVTTVSNHVRDDLVRTLAIDPRGVSVVPNGVDAPGAVKRSSSPERPYVLYVGGHESRKNVAGVLAAMSRYWNAYEGELELRLTGTRESLSADAAAAYRGLKPETAVQFIGTVGDDELGRLYAGATALLLLSRAEGFGLPALEAMAHGCPVIAANAASLPEVVGDAGLLVDPDDSDQVCGAIRRLVTDSSLRNLLVQRGRERAARFSWRSAAAQMREAYEQAAGMAAVARGKRRPPVSSSLPYAKRPAAAFRIDG
jgi:glycosyltransferase involved in cell wall biosynthesis